MKKGFTLIELLIVVAIIAILAAIAVPNFLEAQVRSKVSRVKSDQRSLATALEAYYVDNNLYPAAARGTSTAVIGGTGPNANVQQSPTAEGNVNGKILPVNAALVANYSFAAQQATGAKMGTLTTPIAYITSLFPDPFMDTKAATSFYFANSSGWILWSPGPDTDQNTGGDLGLNQSVETVYDIRISQPSVVLLTGGPGTAGSYSYDPTNGTVSPGDVYRVKQ